jgi:hypothetical protein
MGRPDIRRSSSRQGIGGLFQPTLLIYLLAHRALNPPTSSSLADGKACPLASPQFGGARFPTLAESD